MLAGLDAIPWATLTHAYGSAEDVPGWLRAQATASPDLSWKDMPLSKLFGSIWHQGTVYEATAYAVPFLIELAASPQVPRRAEILQLLAAIARGSSYRAVHGNLSREPDFEERKAQELAWVAAAARAVGAGLETFLVLAKEQGELRLAAAHVLAQLPEHAETVRPLLHALLEVEAQPLHRAGLLLLMAQCGDPSNATLPTLLAALDSQEEIERRAAVLSIAWLKPQPLPELARGAILAAVIIDEIEESFRGLPWDIAAEIANQLTLYDCLDGAGRNDTIERLIGAIDAGDASHRRIELLLNMLFHKAENYRTPSLTARDLTPLQMRAVGAMARAVRREGRVFSGRFSWWGLPNTERELAALVSGTGRT